LEIHFVVFKSVLSALFFHFIAPSIPETPLVSNEANEQKNLPEKIKLSFILYHQMQNRLLQCLYLKSKF